MSKAVQVVVARQGLWLCLLAACASSDRDHGAGLGSASAATASRYSVGGVVWGLLPNTLVRLSNGTEQITVGNSPFIFPTSLADGDAFNVSVGAQPTQQTCTVSNGTGVMGQARVTNVSIQCSATAVTVGGTVQGLAALSAVTLTNQGVSLMLSANGAFTLPGGGFTFGTPYEVSVWADPIGEHCTVANGVGVVNGQAVDNIAVTCVPATAPQLRFATDQDAAVEIGQPTMNAAITAPLRSGATLYNADRFDRFNTKPCGWPGGPLYINDFWNFRVLVFNGMPSSNFTSADSVMGASNLTDSGDGSIFPMATNCALNMLVVTNQPGFDSTFAYTGFPIANPNTVVTTEKIAFDCDLYGNSNPTDVAIFGGKMLIADPGHNRIRTWNTVPNDPYQRQDPDVAFGQASFTTCNAQTTASGFNTPFGFYLGAHHFMVADRGNHRVLIWNRAFNDVVNGDAADVVLGQPNFTTSTGQPLSASSFDPVSVDSDETQVVIADKSNNRVLVWNSIPTMSNHPADVILGQKDATSNACNQSATGQSNPRADTLCDPTGAKLVGPFLVVQDAGNLRVVIYKGR